MRTRCLALTAVLLGANAPVAAAQAPPPLELPSGVPVRVWAESLAGRRVEGTLLGADAASITLVPKGGHPLAPGAMSLPTAGVSRLHVALGKKRHWWQGAVLGAAFGAVLALTDEVDPVLCEVNENVSCSRGEALLDYGLGGAVVGTVVGGLIRTDQWTPVALDALRAPPGRPVHESRALSFQASLRF